MSQVVPTGAGTVNGCGSSTGSRSRCREDGAAGQHGGEVLAVVASPLRSDGGLVPVRRRRRGLADGVLGRRPADQRLLDRRARNGGRPMLVNPIRASAMVPPSTRTVAATATIDHWCFTRTNFS